MYRSHFIRLLFRVGSLQTNTALINTEKSFYVQVFLELCKITSYCLVTASVCRGMKLFISYRDNQLDLESGLEDVEL